MSVHFWQLVGIVGLGLMYIACRETLHRWLVSRRKFEAALKSIHESVERASR